jgi:hypothetical protein
MTTRFRFSFLSRDYWSRDSPYTDRLPVGRLGFDSRQGKDSAQQRPDRPLGLSKPPTLWVPRGSKVAEG